jgi:hypothetical protein
VKIENLLHHSHFANRPRRHRYRYPYLKNIDTPFLPYLLMNLCCCERKLLNRIEEKETKQNAACRKVAERRR